MLGSYFGSDDLKVWVLRFLQHYYSIYDSSGRQGLLDAHHDGACCSLTIPFTPQEQPERVFQGQQEREEAEGSQCLQDNDGQVSTQLKMEGKIPEVAFLR
ncbi:hypothetical protein AV530_006650 [Patagioenas fasciata monilis]|uniref:Nuclear transport factor 2 domain-containing protein n=1 Tax=Patagioenas fasciata monilis TaxID=372326 RepID=A0A1V4J2D2_PATFA|nr:hypothetical protein AV530_006650 [Patagioenas fasciata monilis]